MKSAGKARNNGLYRHIRTSKEIIRNLLNDLINNIPFPFLILHRFMLLFIFFYYTFKCTWIARYIVTYSVDASLLGTYA